MGEGGCVGLGEHAGVGLWLGDGDGATAPKPPPQALSATARATSHQVRRRCFIASTLGAASPGGQGLKTLIVPPSGCLHLVVRQMAAFSETEIAYLRGQRIGRLATVGADRQPHVVPVGFRYNPDEDAIEIGGHGGFSRRKKWRDVLANPQVAFVVDDIASVQPWSVRGIEIRGVAETLERGGKEIVASFDDEMFRIRPRRVRSWGLSG